MVWVVLFVAALLLSQTLGFVHRVVHHPFSPAQQVYQGVTQAQPVLAAAVKAPGLLSGLFQHNDDDPTCRIFDQAGGCDSLPGMAPLVLPMALTAFTLLFFEGEVLARRAELFDARGPPSIR